MNNAKLQKTSSGQLEKKILKIDDSVLNFSNKINIYCTKHYFISIIILLIYFLSISIVSYFHEPWGDEAQAWLIGRDCTYKEMIFEIGHLEGHPFLWWIYLSIFAKTGFTYEIGLKLAAIIINSIASYLIIFKAPFHKIFNYSIPFTYFLFYQYGVISRCYSFLILGFILSAIFYNNKKTTPFKMVFALLLLCMSGAYGLIFAFGIALIWVFEIISYFINNTKSSIKISFFLYIKNIKNQVLALLLLLISAVIILILIIPYDNTSGTYLENYNSLFFRLFYTFFLLPADSLIFSSYWGENYLGAYEISVPIMIIGAFIWTLLLLILLTRNESKGYKKLLLIPYFIFSTICANLYMYSHHIGIFALFILFWLWVCFSNKEKNPVPDNSWLIKGEGKLIYNTEWIAFIFMIIIPISWSISSSYEDIIHNYTDSREVMSFLEDYGLNDARIMKPGMYYNIDGEQKYEIAITSLPLITAYLPKNNNTYRSLYKNQYANWVVRTLFLKNNSAEEKELIKLWQTSGYPDVMINKCDLNYIYDSEYQNQNGPIPEYICVKKIRYCLIFKGYYISAGDLGCSSIYLRKDLADNLGLPAK